MERSSAASFIAHPVVREGLRLALLAALLSSVVASVATAADDVEKAPPDKSGYTVLHPTPTSMMRELTPDRPDKTESAYTVDAGHFQLEMSFVQFTRNESDGVRTETWNVAPVNLKVGLCNRADLQLVFDNYLNVRNRYPTTGTTETHSGFGDLTVRLKTNLWGNDGGKTALAALPFVKFPTNTDHLGNHSVEGGVIFPLAAKLPWGFDMGMETAPLVMRDADDRGYHAEVIDSVTFGHDLIGKLGGYVEFFSNVSTERGSDWVGTVDLGLTYDLSENLQLDCGVNIGVTRSADDVNAFTGITARF